jgi:hypothetical protein
VYNLSVVDESNAEGDWSGWKIERGDRLQDTDDNWRDYYNEAISFRDSLKRGEVRGDISAEEEHSSEAAM